MISLRSFFCAVDLQLHAKNPREKTTEKIIAKEIFNFPQLFVVLRDILGRIEPFILDDSRVILVVLGVVMVPVVPGVLVFVLGIVRVVVLGVVPLPVVLTGVVLLPVVLVGVVPLPVVLGVVPLPVVLGVVLLPVVLRFVPFVPVPEVAFEEVVLELDP